TIECGAPEFGAIAQKRNTIPALRLLSLSATGRNQGSNVFKLQGSFDAPPGRREDLDDETVERRLTAEKILTLYPRGTENLEDALAARAWALADHGAAAIRCLVFSNSRDVVEKARKRIEQLARDRKS